MSPLFPLIYECFSREKEGRDGHCENGKAYGF